VTPARKTRSGAEDTYSLGAVVRLTGLSPHVLRAWERRYAAVTPLRTPGGTRRYRSSDVARLRWLRAAVEAGHPIGDVAKLPEAELRRRGASSDAGSPAPLRALLEAIDSMDVEEVDRLLGIQLAGLGPRRFARSVVLPLLEEVGRRWEAQRLCVASEHLASAAVRTLLGSVLRRRSGAAHSPPLVFTTLPGDRHELGALVCAVIAADCGAHTIYLGPDLPPEEAALAVEKTEAAAVVVGMSRYARAAARERAVAELRRALPREVALWVGGSGSQGLALPSGVERIADLEALEQKISLMVLQPGRRRGPEP
jgi:DNA-binding transcriptional MerR regulator/methylmalonyl-CoA mutase cobalamin-binding subunit